MLLLSRFKIHGHSMEPTIKNGQSILASNIPYIFSKPKVGDIVVIRHSGLSALTPALSLRERVRVRVDSGVARLSRAPQNDGKDNKYLIKRIAKIEGDKYFVKGDNERDSLDSRRMGWIVKIDIIGKIIFNF